MQWLLEEGGANSNVNETSDRGLTVWNVLGGVRITHADTTVLAPLLKVMIMLADAPVCLRGQAVFTYGTSGVWLPLIIPHLANKGR